MPNFNVTAKYASGDSVFDTVRERRGKIQFVTWTLSDEDQTPQLTYSVVYDGGVTETSGRYADVTEDELSS